MVRLKDDAKACIISCCILLFQFHYGTIKSADFWISFSFVSYFNSTMVRLKVLRSLRISLVTFAFQIHYCTIKSHLCDECEYSVPLFQFHYGTIKSHELLFVVELFIYFNSTMVRLKDGNKPQSCVSACISIPLWYD